MNKTKTLFKQKISELLKRQGTDAVLSEAALPAYAHNNPLVDYIFWKRLDIAYSFVERSNNNTPLNILDFGCGTGVFSYHLAQDGHNLFALDLDLTPKNLLSSVINYPNNISFNQGDILELDIEGKTFDYIVALDVLEHIPLEILPKYLNKFKSLLKDGGAIIISGPTENILYKLGRKIAGRDFSGEYHETTISKIRELFEKEFNIRKTRKVFWPFTLFEVFVASKR